MAASTAMPRLLRPTRPSADNLDSAALDDKDEATYLPARLWHPGTREPPRVELLPGQSGPRLLNVHRTLAPPPYQHQPALLLRVPTVVREAASSEDGFLASVSPRSSSDASSFNYASQQEQGGADVDDVAPSSATTPTRSPPKQQRSPRRSVPTTPSIASRKPATPAATPAPQASVEPPPPAADWAPSPAMPPTPAPPPPPAPAPCKPHEPPTTPQPHTLPRVEPAPKPKPPRTPQSAPQVRATLDP